jgi:ABC-type Fe3+-hydroxamate transport system substrate-binding protein
MFAKRVLIINGVYSVETGKSFLRIEIPGGYADRFLLSPLGAENVGASMVAINKNVQKGHVIFRKWDKLAKAAPDVIIITGNAPAVQKALSRAVEANPALAKVAAIKNSDIYSLPGFINASVMEYPLILRKWAFVLER